MKRLITILFAVALGPASWGQSECGELLDSDQDGFIGVEDLMNLLSLFGDTDADLDGIWDSVDDCVGVYDACGVCGGTGEDVDSDGYGDDDMGAYICDRDKAFDRVCHLWLVRALCRMCGYHCEWRPTLDAYLTTSPVATGHGWDPLPDAVR